MSTDEQNLNIIVVGASGHLARTKVLPALFALYCQGFLPSRFEVLGYARTPLSTEAFRRMVEENLSCRYTPGASCQERMQEFLGHCTYVAGQYGSPEDFRKLAPVLQKANGAVPGNLLIYLAVPSEVFLPATRALGAAGFADAPSTGAWCRLVIEKPFGRDRDSSDVLTREMGLVFREEQIYRMDHYLGKEVIQNLLVLRFANLIFEPIWNRQYIKCVQISWKENLTIEGRGGYFDNTGIIRDVMQNHLLQIMSLVAMEPPPRWDATHIRNAKVNALLCVPPPTRDDIVIGQYTGTQRGGIAIPGYRDDPSVPPDSHAVTYAAASLQVVNARWDGVPFMLRAGKALDGRSTEIRIQFRNPPGQLFALPGSQPNELVIRVQPDEAIIFRVLNKVPGLENAVELRDLDMQYKTAFTQLIPEAYEDLLLDIIRGEKSLFIREDELAAAWDIFTPILREIDDRHLVPEPYEFGTTGPGGAHQLAAKHGMTWI